MKVLGLSVAHDSSVVLLNNGKVELFLKEERLTGIKRDMMPYRALFEAIHYARDVDVVCITSPTPNNIHEISLVKVLKKFFKCPIISYGDDHHLTHASLAFYNSGFTNSLVFVIDRNGSPAFGLMREAETVYEASYPCEFKTLHKNYWVYNSGNDHDPELHRVKEQLKSADYSFSADNMSIVRVYESATTLIGQDPLENGKTMGLSSYGRDIPFIDLFNEGRPVDHLFTNVDFLGKDMPTTLLKSHIDKITHNLDKDNYQEYADYAYQVQKQTQEVTKNFISEWVNKTGITNVCITGGYGMNVVANEYYIKSLPHCNFYFEPLCDDSGNSIGAAIHAYRNETKNCEIIKLEHTFIHGLPQKPIKVGEQCTTEDIADFLINQKVVAVFNGLAESGSRALGNRSILFDARNKNAKEIVNKVKNREWYRPFAAMILKEHFNKYFESNGLDESKFMCVSFQTKKPDVIPGVVHVDNSCRAQTVDPTIPHIHELLTDFNNKTSCPVLLNTSFNLAGKPLIETQEDAIKCFRESSIDVLWFPETKTCLVK